MTTLSERLLVEPCHQAVVADCATLVEQQVASRGPVRRLTLKAGIGILNSVKPNGLKWAVGRLLPDFVEALEPLYQRFAASGNDDFSRFLAQNSDEAVEALLAAADRRASRVSNAVLVSGYKKMRPIAQSELRDAMPGLGGVLARHL